MYIAPGQGQPTSWGQTLMSTENPNHFTHGFVASFKTISTRFYMFFPHVWVGTDKPLGSKFNVNRKALLFWWFAANFERHPSDFIHIV